MSEPAPVRRFVCGACGHAHAAWAPRCVSCFAHGLALASVPEVPTFAQAISAAAQSAPQEEEEWAPEPSRLRLVRSRAPDPDLEDPAEELADVYPAEIVPSSVPVPLSDVAEDELPRDSTGLAPLDAVLGGGLVPGSVISLSGPAGCGKSTLTMQMLAGLNLRALLATGEETIAQASARARRIGAAPKKVLIVAETDLKSVIMHAQKTRAQVLMVDSIQTLICSDVKSAAGSPAQVRECTSRLVKFAKTTETSVIMTVHMTNDDRMAGPSTLRHLVDIVLELELGARFEGNERQLKCIGKNRCGPSNVVGYFELTVEGLVPVDSDGWGTAKDF